MNYIKDGNKFKNLSYLYKKIEIHTLHSKLFFLSMNEVTMWANIIYNAQTEMLRISDNSSVKSNVNKNTSLLYVDIFHGRNILILTQNFCIFKGTAKTLSLSY